MEQSRHLAHDEPLHQFPPCDYPFIIQLTNMPSTRVLLAFLASCLGLYAAWSWGSQSTQPHALTDGKRPNIVFVLTDDQDLHMDSLAYMPHTQKLIADQGTTFANHFCTNALCCPSRVTLWTGKSPHNTNVTDVNPPHGRNSSFHVYDSTYF